VIIAVDGPAASGKGTLAGLLARHFGLPHLDTGLLYRGVGLAVLDHLDAPDLEARAVAAAESLDKTALDAVRLGTSELGAAASKISRFEKVRAALRQFQREFAGQPGGAVLDGRDIGTRICPDADVKIFITADPAIRARRRAEQLRARGLPADEPAILAQILARDEADRDNPAGAFYRAEDAHLLDTSQLDIEAAFRAALGIVERTIARKDGRKT
jgi:cytidylate kinase